MTLRPELTAALGDRYVLMRELGAGGMANVYLAEDTRHHRQVAVKVLRAELALSLGADRFLREITLAAGLQHPNILPLFDSGGSGDVLYYVMPFVDGESLRDRLTRAGALPVDDAMRVLREVADALGHAHRRGLIHRDIKPENIMLADGHALVTDFGIAKAVRDAAPDTALTATGLAMGMPAYMAPEQAMADARLDHRVDLYAFGVMAYEMLAGYAPFSGSSAQQIIAANLTRTPEAITAVRPNVPASLAQLVMRCLEKSPADRVQSADEIVRLIDGMKAGVTGTSVASAVASTRASGATHEQTATPAAATSSSQRSRRGLRIAAGVALLAATGIGAGPPASLAQVTRRRQHARPGVTDAGTDRDAGGAGRHATVGMDTATHATARPRLRHRRGARCPGRRRRDHGSALIDRRHNPRRRDGRDSGTARCPRHVRGQALELGAHCARFEWRFFAVDQRGAVGLYLDRRDDRRIHARRPVRDVGGFLAPDRYQRAPHDRNTGERTHKVQRKARDVKTRGEPATGRTCGKESDASPKKCQSLLTDCTFWRSLAESYWERGEAERNEGTRCAAKRSRYGKVCQSGYLTAHSRRVWLRSPGVAETCQSPPRSRSSPVMSPDMLPARYPA